MIKQNLIVFEKDGINYLLRDEEVNRSRFAQPNFKHTKKALVGILRVNETIEQFVDRINSGRKRRDKEAQQALCIYQNEIYKKENETMQPTQRKIRNRKTL